MEFRIRLKVKSFIIYILFKTNKLTPKLLDKINFENLIFLSKKIKNHSEYERLILRIVELQERLIKEKAKNRKIKIGFIGDSSNVWGFDDVYKILEDKNRYIPYVIIPLRVGSSKQEEDMKILKQEAVCYFKNKKMKYYVVKEKKKAQWGNKLPDILLSQVPYYEPYYQKNFCIENMPCSCMQMFVPYTFWIAKMVDASFAHSAYMKIYSKIFAPSKIHMEFMKKIAGGGIDEKRLFYSGYPKLDSYYKEKVNSDIDSIWKNGKNKKRIIYAPGFMDPAPSFCTFNLNYMKMLDIARQTKDTVSWIIRLHPIMAGSCIEQGVFANINEWNDYINEWEKLENATVSIHGSYKDIFNTSDGMIMDSISFLPSYQYVHKPLLLLTRQTQKMNKLGNMLKEVIYTADAKNMEDVKDFIKEVIIKGIDSKKEVREEFFKKNLDYYYQNRQLASEYIVNIIEDLL